MNRWDYVKIDHLMGSLDRYIQQGIPTGHFLEAVLSNDLKNACDRADDQNLWLLPIIVAWLYNNAPIRCWGSKEAVEGWLKEKARTR